MTGKKVVGLVGFVSESGGGHKVDAEDFELRGWATSSDFSLPGRSMHLATARFYSIEIRAKNVFVRESEGSCLYEDAPNQRRLDSCRPGRGTRLRAHLVLIIYHRRISCNAAIHSREHQIASKRSSTQFYLVTYPSCKIDTRKIRCLGLSQQAGGKIRPSDRIDSIPDAP